MVMDAQDFGAGPYPTIQSVEPAEGQIMLIDPQYAGYQYGPNADIKFGPAGGFPDHIWIGSAEHELLSQMLLRRPDIRESVPGPQVIIMCPMCPPGTEFRSQRAFVGHAAKVHRASANVKVALPNPPAAPTPEPVLAGVREVALDAPDDDEFADIIPVSRAGEGAR